MRKLIKNLEKGIPGFNKVKFYVGDIMCLCRCHGFDIYPDTGSETYCYVGEFGCRLVVHGSDVFYPGEAAYRIAHEFAHHLLGHNPNTVTHKEEWHATVIALILRIPNPMLEWVQYNYGTVDSANIFKHYGPAGQNPINAIARYESRSQIYQHYREAA